MLRDIFRSIGGIENYGIISTVIFAVFFFLLTLHAVRRKREEMDECSRMPFDDGHKEINDHKENQ
ncbi:MAG TPA: cbb3-type cytochrome c oxidase subunit 3 [Bacteroidales bacterium]|nr:cbb3-type cytochrome c oxidase subunit 3 [Bacteroidales bacterium]HPS61740.1 cbb3-type cytochrome c oxidase subunit 3 [Bacteroidales bacterium]